MLHEVSAIADKKTLLHMYKSATNENVGFLTVKLTNRDKRRMIMVRFDNYIEMDE